MAKRKRSRSAHPMHCRRALSRCMRGGGRRRAGGCMRAYQRCRRRA